MATQRGFNSWFTADLPEETSYGTAQTIDSTSFIEKCNGEPFELVAIMEDGTTLIGASAEEATEQTIVAWEARASREFRFRLNTLAMVAAYGMGNISHVADEPSAGYYTHTITPFPKTFLSAAYVTTPVPSTEVNVDDTGSFPATGTLIFEDDLEEWSYTSKTATAFDAASLPSNNHADNVPVHLKFDTDTLVLPSMTAGGYFGGVTSQYPGVLVSSFTLRASKKAFATISTDLVGRGNYTSPAITKPTAITDESYLKAGDCTITRVGTWDGRTFSGGTAISAAVNSLEWTWNNNLDDTADYVFGGGLYRGRGERTRRTQTVKLAVELEDLTYLGYLTGQTSVNLNVVFAGSASYSASLVFPQLKMVGTPITGGTGILLTSADAAVQQHATYGSAQLTIVNKKSGYVH